MFHFKEAGPHGAECPQVSPSSWSIESSTVVKHDTIVLMLDLLEVLGLPQDATLSSATEAFKEVQFVCLCGDPRYEGHFDFEGLVSTSNLTATAAAKLVI